MDRETVVTAFETAEAQDCPNTHLLFMNQGATRSDRVKMDALTPNDSEIHAMCPKHSPETVNVQGLGSVSLEATILH